MSEVTDLLLQVFDPAQALLFVALALVDYVQVKILLYKWNKTDDRITRLEKSYLATDGGEEYE